jgi:arylsulfatase A-like enzyme
MGDPDPFLPEANGDQAPSGQGAVRPPARPTDVLLVVLDAAAARHFGCYGHSRPTTPEIDRIAAEGVVYERAYSPSVFTRSAMASIWTSQYPDQHRVGVDAEKALSPRRTTLAELLRAAGVHPAAFIGNRVAGGFGLDRGFAEFHDVYQAEGAAGGFSRAEAFRGVLSGYFERRPASRLFTYVHFLEPHFPYDPPPPFDTLFGPDSPLTRAERRELHWLTAVNEGRITPTPEQVEHLERLYDGSLAYVDREVGVLRRTLERAGLWENTLVIVTSDHGEGLYEHGWIGHMKRVNEEAARVPLVVRHPAGRGPAGTRVTEVVSLLDLAPTIADALGVAVPAAAFRGHSLLRGAPGARVVTRNAETPPTYAVTEGRYRLILKAEDGGHELYDLTTDAGETRHLADAQPGWAAAHRQALQWFLMNLRPDTPAPAAPLGPAELEALRALGYWR